jgi:hypothetical protein
MLKIVASRTRSLFVVLLLAGFSGLGAVEAKSLAGFAGNGTGLILISQGKAVVVGNANPKVKASAKSAKFNIKCTINNVAANQTITLKHGRATVNHLLPGLSGFSASASGTYKLNGNKVRAILPFTAGSSKGTLYIQIDTTPFGSTLRVSSQLLYSDGTAPIYATIIAN